MFDIDRFKKINDTYGHVAGDRVLVSITHQISANFRQSDVACRYGGDEFLVLLMGMDEEGAHRVSERLREIIAASPVSFGNARIPVTISGGIATATGDDAVSLESLIERADRALYAAKQAGRDRIMLDPASAVASSVPD
jgi:diguanylate cyclase (GGDEF)-like protein